MLSSLILTEQLSREEALTKIAQPAYPVEEMKQDFEYIANKLGITVQELEQYRDGPNKTYRDYKNAMTFNDIGTWGMPALGKRGPILR